MRYRTCCAPVHSITHTPTGEQEIGYSQYNKCCPGLIDVVRANKTREFRKADSTLRSSQAVPHPSTNRALCRLTSEVR